MRRTVLLFLAVFLLAPMVAMGQSGAPKGGSLGAQLVSLQNAYIRVIAAGDGSFVEGTTGGDPNITGDENKPLLYGYPAGHFGTGYPSIRVVRSGVVSDTILIYQPRTLESTIEGNAIVTRWRIDDVEVTQRLSLFLNPYTNREDQCLITYQVRNVGQVALDVGVRSMLDLAVGSQYFFPSGDEAPFFLPQAGRIKVEREFGSGDLPEYYKAYESPEYSVDSLRALGIVNGFGMTPPDRFVLATWQSTRGSGRGVFQTRWDYVVTPGALLGDSAVVSYWGPRTLAPGQEYTVRQSYGLGGDGGGRAWLEAPLQLECQQSAFAGNLWVANTWTETLFNGQATITLPPGLRLASGQSPTRALGNLLPGDVRTQQFLLETVSLNPASLTFTVTVTFTNLPDPLVTRATVIVPNCPVPTVTGGTPQPPTRTPVATLRPTGQPTVPVPTPTPVPPPEIPEPGSIALVAIGLAGLALKLRRRRS